MSMRDARIGEELASIDGQQSSITGVFPQGVEKIYRVTFSDGRFVDCSGDHLWKIHFVHQYSEAYGMTNITDGRYLPLMPSGLSA
jgi:hypothetical protein